MTQDEKQLLLKDLSARLPYDVKIHYHWERKETGQIVDVDRDLDFSDVDSLKYTLAEPQDNWCIIDWKPYLRPMSSMTEEEKEEYNKTKDKIAVQWDDYGTPIGYEYTYTIKTFDWLLAHHFDYRGLIEKGIALEAKEEMYKND